MSGRNGARQRGAAASTAADVGDTFTGTGRVDHYDGTAFDDVVTLLGGDDVAHGNAGNDAIDGGAGDDTLTGDAGNDRITTSTGHDSVDGGAGNDVVTADDFGVGDRLDGGLGKDQLYLTVTGTRALNAELTGDGSGEVTIGGGQATISNFESMVFHLGGGKDQVVFDFFSGTVTLDGGDGNDRLVGGSGRDTLIGGNGNDLLYAQGGNDVLDGGDGNDRLSGSSGDDTMDGGAGNDIFIVDSAKDVVRDASGVDTVETSIDYVLGESIENGTLTFGAGDLSLTGNALRNTLLGNDGGNRIVGGAGADRLDGGAGDDRLDGGTGHDTLTGGDGTDNFVLTPGGASDTITDFVHGADTIILAGAALGLATGPLDADVFASGKTAQDADDRVLYDISTGALYIDRDGSGAHFAAVQIAQLSPGVTVSAADVLVI